MSPWGMASQPAVPASARPSVVDCGGAHGVHCGGARLRDTSGAIAGTSTSTSDLVTCHRRPFAAKRRQSAAIQATTKSFGSQQTRNSSPSMGKGTESDATVTGMLCGCDLGTTSRGEPPPRPQIHLTNKSQLVCLRWRESASPLSPFCRALEPPSAHAFPRRRQQGRRGAETGG